MGVLIFGALVHANTVITNPKLFHSKYCDHMGLGLNTSHAHYRAMWDLIGLPAYSYDKVAYEIHTQGWRWESEMELRGADYIFQAHRLRSSNMLFPYEQVIRAVREYLFPRSYIRRCQDSSYSERNPDIDWAGAHDAIGEFYDDHLIEMRAQCRNVTHIAILP